MDIKINLNDLTYRYEVYQIFNIFYTFDNLIFVENDADYKVTIDDEINLQHDEIVYNYKIKDQNKKEEIKREVFKFLKDVTKDNYPWGTLVGIRPSKIALKLLEQGKTESEIINYFNDTYLASEEKAKLCIEVAKNESKFVNRDEKKVSIYIGMPFCPTRCLYCSFAANPIAGCKKIVNPYLDALYKEIDSISKYVREKKLKIETVYFGGGTPTSVSNEQFHDVMQRVYTSFVEYNSVKEFTVECGRPDSITEEKLNTMKKFNVTRISINPQSMNEDTMKVIGRGHTPEDIKEKFLLAKRLGFDNINMDIIVGLPNETIKHIENTCREIEKLSPDSLTIHGLSIKRASRLHENIVLKHEVSIAKQEELVNMYKMTGDLARKLNMTPYYMYRQKNMVGNMENLGYSIKGKECVYNIEMIEDTQSIIALGADAVSKIVFLEESRIERFGNVKDVREYINRIDEMIERKIELLNSLY